MNRRARLGAKVDIDMVGAGRHVDAAAALDEIHLAIDVQGGATARVGRDDRGSTSARHASVDAAVRPTHVAIADPDRLPVRPSRGPTARRSAMSGS